MVPVVVRYKKPPLRLPCSGFTARCCVPGVRVACLSSAPADIPGSSRGLLILFSPRGLAVWRRPEVKKNAAAMGRRAFRRSTFWLLFFGGVVWVRLAKWFSWAI